MRVAAVLVLLLVALTGCTKFRSYDGPEVTRIVVFKEERRMYLMHKDQVLRGFDVDLGFAPVGHKRRAGDGRTPVGRYFIDRRNPESRFHLSLGLNYPNARDVARARAAGVNPGGNIFIHGSPNGRRLRGDWTYGCIAVSNREMEDIYAMVENGTVIDIFPRAAAARRPVRTAAEAAADPAVRARREAAMARAAGEALAN